MDNYKWRQRQSKFQVNKNDDLIDRLASIRGIENVDEFLSPTRDSLCNPFEMKNIEKAANRIISAISEGEKICISIDPDMDGMASFAIMYRYLRKYTDNVTWIHGERSWGHGIHNQITYNNEKERDAKVDENKEAIKSSDLLLLIDSSSNDEEACKLIEEEWETEIIIIDHHDIERENNYGLLVNPKQQGCNYKNKDLSAAGVVYKVLEVLESKLDQVDIEQFIDLVAIGIYADVMPVDVMENRYLIMSGLRNINNPGIKRILKSAKTDIFRSNSDTIGFTIGPLFNGVARMGDLSLGIEMLLEDEDKACQQIQRKMKVLNKKRKKIQDQLTKSYLKTIDRSAKVIIAIDDNASASFNGLVAQSLSEKFKRPAIVLRRKDGKLAGSFRSYNGLDFKAFVNQLDFITSQGHPGAGGVTLKEEDLNELKLHIEMNLISEEADNEMIYDLEYNSSEEAILDIETIERFNTVTGNGFPKILVRLNFLEIYERKVIGDTKNTVKFSTFNEIQLIKFRVNEAFGRDIGCFDEVSVVGPISYNVFYNFQLREEIITPQVMIDDIKLN